MSSFILKIIALITMTIDHFSIIILRKPAGFLRVIGRIAFPLFAFQLVQGFIHTKNRLKHCTLLLIFAFISQVPFELAFNIKSLNIFFTLFLGFVAIWLFEFTYNSLKSYIKNHNKILYIISLIVILPFAFLGNIYNVDYGAWGILVICLFYFTRNCKKFIIPLLGYAALCIFKYWNVLLKAPLNINVWLNLLGTFIPIVLIYFYNGRKGKSMKYLFYIYYPAHLILLHYLATFFII